MSNLDVGVNRIAAEEEGSIHLTEKELSSYIAMLRGRCRLGGQAGAQVSFAPHKIHGLAMVVRTFRSGWLPASADPWRPLFSPRVLEKDLV